jgi:hypothetical protein
VCCEYFLKIYEIGFDFDETQIGEPAELHFSLYNMTAKKFITEDYMIALTVQGMPEDINKIGKVKPLFKVSSYTTHSVK